jgi:tetratricopeptide (TPR) repeat protein
MAIALGRGGCTQGLVVSSQVAQEPRLRCLGVSGPSELHSERQRQGLLMRKIRQGWKGLFAYLRDSEPTFLGCLRAFLRPFRHGWFVVVILALLAGAWAASQTDAVRWIGRALSSWPLPNADTGRFSILVAELEADDATNTNQRLVLEALRELPFVQVLRLPRRISSAGLDASTAELEGHNRAKGYLRRTGATVALWGIVLRHEGKESLKLYWTTAGEVPGWKERYQFEERDFRLPPLFHRHLALELGAVVSTQASGFQSELDPRIIGRVDRFIVRLREVVRPDARIVWSPVERASALLVLGDSLSLLGREAQRSGPLHEAIAAYREALLYFSRDRYPLDWAMTQNNLGNALANLGLWESGTAHTKEAIAAYREALTVNTRERDRMDWARAQNNLGCALSTLGERESGVAYLEEAVFALRGSLTERTRERVPVSWALTQNNLGLALRSLGERQEGTASFEGAAAAFGEALKEYTRERAPRRWAETQGNVGVALARIAERTARTEVLKQAIVAFRRVQEVNLRDEAPLTWSRQRSNLGNALRSLSLLERNDTHLEEAVALQRQALSACPRELAPRQWAETQMNLGNALMALAGPQSRAEYVEHAIAAYRAALTELTDANAPQYAGYLRDSLQKAEALLQASRKKGGSGGTS